MIDTTAKLAHPGVMATGLAASEVLVVLEKELRVLALGLVARSSVELSALEHRLTALAADLTDDADGRSAVSALAEVCQAALSQLRQRGLADQGGQLEAESLAARMLGEIGRGARVGNADLAQLLETDPWQLSRAGRRLRDAGLATRTRSGRINVWDLTSEGRAELNRLSGPGIPNEARLNGGYSSGSNPTYASRRR